MKEEGQMTAFYQLFEDYFLHLDKLTPISIEKEIIGLEMLKMLQILADYDSKIQVGNISISYWLGWKGQNSALVCTE